MLKKSLLQVLILPLAFLISNNSAATALPGQATEQVETWIKAHPTLSPRSGERFLVTKTDTAAQRFSFQAMVSAPGRVTFSKNRSQIRTERISMYDAINGMSLDRLKESLRIIYGLDIYQDYKGAQVIYEYPNQSAINAARFAKTPIREGLTGELRVGDRYAYWVEVAQAKNGKAYTGQMTVFLKSDLDKLEEELRNR
ncbi:MAG: hypothetical protein HC836_04955 [Richelia sp. RM2_1_2]|nr:hypothetical protein [Richelia sp. SM2_1_7]NJN08991.1 hypothetical protein [Richelia sp. RM1_1_1]NJO26619.1 hypothetical protein [Richelia sp. SL_2_1]NJO57729.1 hypothetical protein [Richelia sp. RM2_1_2]NJS16102.1 hypothetical protein [Nostocaceae cyanobacterium CSU_2_110]